MCFCFWWTITAQVTENVYDSPTERFLLIPQGTRLIGIYDSQVAFGQSRVLLIWTRLIMPNGRSIVLERQPGADTAGYAGLEMRSTITGAPCSRQRSYRHCSASAANLDLLPVPAAIVMSSQHSVADPAIA
jgi:Bacterial conjugation TrbI-like protein